MHRVEDALREVRVGRCQHVVACLLPVDVQFVQPRRVDIDLGAADRNRQFKALSQPRVRERSGCLSRHRPRRHAAGPQRFRRRPSLAVRARLPRGIRHHVQRRAGVKGDAKLEQQPRRIRQIAAVGRPDCQQVLPGAQQRRNVRRHRFLPIIPLSSPRAIDRQLEGVVRGGDNHRLNNFPVRRQHHAPPEMAHARRRTGRRIALGGPDPLRTGQRRISGGMRNPLCRPVLRFQLAHHPGGRRAPGRRLVLLIPDAHLPEHRLSGNQRLASVRHIEALCGRNLATVPQIALVACQQRRGGSGQDTVRRLRLVLLALVRLEAPGKLRRCLIHTARRCQPFATQIRRHQRRTGGNHITAPYRCDQHHP